MKRRATQFTIINEVVHRHEADERLKGAGTAVVVRRGLLRSLVISCPDYCGEILTINLDNRAGPAWELYQDNKGVSIFPSIWRESGCESHFIVWRSRIFWCDSEDEFFNDMDFALEERVFDQLDNTSRPYLAIARILKEIPWAVLTACNRLVKLGKAEAGIGKERTHYRRRR